MAKGCMSFTLTALSLALSICSGSAKVDTCLQSSSNSCKQSCTSRDDTCPVMNCGKATNTTSCQQICVSTNTPCGSLHCGNNVKMCQQTCLDCPRETKITCSSEKCEQICSGKNCMMECSDAVKICKQTCSKGATCSLTCGKNTKCVSFCENANCVYKGTTPVVPPVTLSSCDEERCSKNCSGDCQDTVLSCNNTKLCNLVCENGCKMECGKTVTTCNQQCRGNTRCHHSCYSETCNIKSDSSSSLGANHFHSHAIFVFSVISDMYLLLITN